MSERAISPAGDEMPAASTLSARHRLSCGPWWLEGTPGHRHHWVRFAQIPPPLVVLGGMWAALVGFVLVVSTVSHYRHSYDDSDVYAHDSWLSVYGTLLTAFAAVAAARAPRVTRLRLPLRLIADGLFAATLLAWLLPAWQSSAELARAPVLVVSSRVAGGITFGFGVYAITHLHDATPALGRALAIVAVAPLPLGLLVSMLQSARRDEPNAGMVALAVVLGLVAAVAWRLAARRQAATAVAVSR